jgi:DNA-directed RNA polymerase specialized sigma24 family protein
MTFRPLPDSQLERLTDEDLAAYASQASAAGADGAAGRALAILAWGHEPWIQWEVSKKVPAEDTEAVVDSVIESAGFAALMGNAQFKGSTRGQYRAWLSTIIKRRIADFWREPIRANERLALAEDIGNDEDKLGVQLVQRHDADAVVARIVVQDTLARLRPDHAHAMWLVEIGGFSAEEAARRIPGMTCTNVYKIRERFRNALRDY